MISPSKTDDKEIILKDLYKWPGYRWDPMGNIPTIEEILDPLKEDCIEDFDKKVAEACYRPLMTCRCSDDFVEVVLAVTWIDLTEYPIYLAWKNFKVQEREYTPYEKAACAIYFGLTKFDCYFNEKFTIVSDNLNLVKLYQPLQLHLDLDILPSVLQFVGKALLKYPYRIIYRTESQIWDSLG